MHMEKKDQRLENLGTQMPGAEGTRLPQENKVLPPGVTDKALTERQDHILKTVDLEKSKLKPE